MRQGDSKVCKDLLKIKQLYLQGRLMVDYVGGGELIFDMTLGVKLFLFVNSFPNCLIFVVIKCALSNKFMIGVAYEL